MTGVFVFQVRTPRLREGKPLAQGCRDGKPALGGVGVRGGIEIRTK